MLNYFLLNYINDMIRYEKGGGRRRRKKEAGTNACWDLELGQQPTEILQILKEKLLSWRQGGIALISLLGVLGAFLLIRNAAAGNQMAELRAFRCSRVTGKAWATQDLTGGEGKGQAAYSELLCFVRTEPPAEDRDGDHALL